MSDYKLTTKFNWLETKQELEKELLLWGVTDWVLTPPNQTAVSLRYIVHGKEIILTMAKQSRAQDNLRVILFTIQSLRMNEVRGMSEIFESAYLQLNAPVLEKDPYDVLGLPRGTALPVCEAQYRELVKQYHPDKPGGSIEKTKEITEAIVKLRNK